MNTAFKHLSAFFLLVAALLEPKWLTQIMGSISILGLAWYSFLFWCISMRYSSTVLILKIIFIWFNFQISHSLWFPLCAAPRWEPARSFLAWCSNSEAPRTSSLCCSSPRRSGAANAAAKPPHPPKCRPFYRTRKWWRTCSWWERVRNAVTNEPPTSSPRAARLLRWTLLQIRYVRDSRFTSNFPKRVHVLFSLIAKFPYFIQ